ncbi:unnamed protein product, partial [Mesorhabditis spiculigera]
MQNSRETLSLYMTIKADVAASKTAREKHRNVTCEEVAGALAADKIRLPQHVYRSGQQPKSAPVSARGTKTLAWFLADTTIDKKMNLSASSSPINKHPPQQLDKMLAGQKESAERRKRRVKKAKTRHDSHTTPSEGSAPSDALGDEKQKIVTDFKEDYWYYDVTSDGYYYEQNGAKGWRRRQPNTDPKKYFEQVTNVDKLPTTTVPPPNAANQLGVDPRALQILQQALYGQQPAYKYYDPNSDGYYYEMASVDGWRKRQPTRPASQQAPRLPTATPQQQASFQSYGAALARGQMPRAWMFSESSASSSSSDETAVHDALLAQMDELSVDTTLARPNKLAGPELLSSFNVDRFLENSVFPEQKAFDMWSSRSPLSPLKTANSVLETPRAPFEAPRLPMKAQEPTWSGWGISAQEPRAKHLPELQKIWQAPTPTA